MIFHLVPQTAAHRGVLICSRVLETAGNTEALLSLLIFMLLDIPLMPQHKLCSHLQIPSIPVTPDLPHTQSFAKIMGKAQGEGSSGGAGSEAQSVGDLKVWPSDQINECWSIYSFSNSSGYLRTTLLPLTKEKSTFPQFWFPFQQVIAQVTTVHCSPLASIKITT